MSCVPRQSWSGVRRALTVWMRRRELYQRAQREDPLAKDLEESQVLPTVRLVVRKYWSVPAVRGYGRLQLVPRIYCSLCAADLDQVCRRRPGRVEMGSPARVLQREQTSMVTQGPPSAEHDDRRHRRDYRLLLLLKAPHCPVHGHGSRQGG